MSGIFFNSADVQREQQEWGSLAWLSSPLVSSSKHLVVIEVLISPAGKHNFHKHTNHEEVIYVVEGEIEQWVDQEKRILRAGDSVFIDADVVHGSFNISNQNAKLLAILSSNVGPGGYEWVDVAHQEPWVSLR